MLNLLHINHDEKRRVSLFFFQNFFEGLGVSFFYTLALTYFLNSDTPIYKFPWAYIAAGVGIMIFATVYARFEHHGIPAKLFTGLAIFIVGLLILARFLLGAPIDELYIGIGLLATHLVIYFINKLQFWGMSALTFDVRQSKRVFSVLSAGDLPAKFLGYTVIAKLFSDGTIPLEYLIYAAILSYLASIYILRIIIREEPDLRKHLGHDETEHHTSQELSPIVKGLMVLAVITVFGTLIIEYLFAKEVNHHFELEGGTTLGLISTTLAISYGVATVIKLFLSGRIMQRISLRALIVSMPILLMITIVIFWIVTPSSQKHELYNYFFIILFVIELILKETLNKPLVLSLYQPLSKAQRLDGHTKVKGYFESLGMLIVGFFLLNYYQHHKHIDLNYSTIALMIGLGIWVAIGFGFGRTYLKNLREIISRKLLRGDRSLFLDPDTAGFLRKKLTSHDEFEVINAWDLLQKNGQIEEHDVRIMLQHTNDDYRLRALQFIPSVKLSRRSKQTMLQDLFYDHNKKVQLLSLERFAEIADPDAWQDLYAKFSDTDQRQALYSGLFSQHPNGGSMARSEEILSWLGSNDVDIQAKALNLLEFTDFHPFHEEIKPFLTDPEPQLCRAAIQAAVKHSDEEVVSKLIELLEQRRFAFEVVRCLSVIPDNLLDHLASLIKGNGEYRDRKVISALIAHSDAGRERVKKFLPNEKPQMRDILSVELMSQSQKLKGDKAIRGQMDFEVNLLDKLNLEVADKDLQKALDLERSYITVRLLRWCYIFTGERALLKAIDHYLLGDSDKIGMTIEALQVSLPQSVFSMIRPHIEDARTEVTQDVKKFMEEFLKEHKSYRDWLVGTFVRKLMSLELAMANELQHRDSRFISECLDGMESFTHMEKSDKTSIKLLERVLLLKQTAMFSTTDENYLLEIAEVMTENEVPAGSTIFSEGDEGNSMYIIVSGEVQINADGHTLATLGETEFFGDLSLLDPAPRSASAMTTRDSVILELNDAAIYELMSDHIDVTRGIIRVLCERLRRQNIQYLKEKQKVEQYIT